MILARELASLYRRDLRRLGQQITAFPTEESLWQTLPGIANCAGNLTLHLEGNLREYIGRQLGALVWTRNRPAEFSSRDVPQAQLAARIASLAEDIPGVIEELSQETLRTPYPEDVLGQPLSTSQFLIHLSGHLNYHLGQLDYLRRVLTGQSAIPLTSL